VEGWAEIKSQKSRQDAGDTKGGLAPNGEAWVTRQRAQSRDARSAHAPEPLRSGAVIAVGPPSDGDISRWRTEMQRRDAGLKPGATKAKPSVSDDEKLAVVLGVELAVGADGDGGVSSADGGVEEHFSGGSGEDSGVGLRQFVNVAVLAVDVDVAEHVDGGHIDAPFVAVGMIVVDGGALELPLDIEIRVELSDVIRARGSGCADRAVAGAIGSGRVVIVFDHDGESVVVSPNARSGIPSESVSADVISQRIKTEKMAA
jgi:hypothetical protein